VHATDQPDAYPFRCITLPPGISAPEGDRFVNFGTLVEPPTGAFGSPDLTVVVCSSRIREAMVCLNFPSPEEFAQKAEEADALRDELATARLELEAERAKNERIAGLVTQDGYRVNKVKGPKPKEVANGV
jgi:hypothetical protein